MAEPPWMGLWRPYFCLTLGCEAKFSTKGFKARCDGGRVRLYLEIEPKAMQIDELLANAKQGATMVVPGTWGQGRTVFGGLSAALLNRAMSSELAADRLMRVQNTQFIGPLLLDQPFEIEVIHLRDGKNVTQLQAQLIQAGHIVVQATAAFGGDRISKAIVEAPVLTGLEPPNKANWIPQIPKVTPKFHRYIDLKVDAGHMPFTGRDVSIYQGWKRFSQPPAEIGDSHVIALIDVWPPAILQLLKWPAPASTLAWNVEFIHPHPVIEPQDWLYYDCSTRQAARGYGHTEASVYSQQGQLIALSRQTVTVFD